MSYKLLKAILSIMQRQSELIHCISAKWGSVGYMYFYILHICLHSHSAFLGVHWKDFQFIFETDAYSLHPFSTHLDCLGMN